LSRFSSPFENHEDKGLNSKIITVRIKFIQKKHLIRDVKKLVNITSTAGILLEFELILLKQITKKNVNECLILIDAIFT